MALIGGLGWWQAREVRFDYDLRNLQSEGLPAVKWEKDLINRAQGALFGAVAATNREHALALTAKLEQRTNTVKEVVSMAPFIGPQDPEKQAIDRKSVV